MSHNIHRADNYTLDISYGFTAAAATLSTMLYRNNLGRQIDGLDEIMFVVNSVASPCLINGSKGSRYALTRSLGSTLFRYGCWYLTKESLESEEFNPKLLLTGLLVAGVGIATGIALNHLNYLELQRRIQELEEQAP